MPIKTMYWFHINKLKETKYNSSFTLTMILIFWDTKVYIWQLCDIPDNEDHR